MVIIESAAPSKKPIPWWDARLFSDVDFRVQAHTKSEARAAIKRALALRRLPVGTVLTRS